MIPEPDRSQVEKIVSQTKDRFYYPSELWVRILYDYAVAYRYEAVPRQALLDSLIPFYYSRMLSYINKTRDMETRECEEYSGRHLPHLREREVAPHQTVG